MKSNIDFALFILPGFAFSLLSLSLESFICDTISLFWFFFAPVGILIFRYKTTGRIYIKTEYIEGERARKWILGVFIFSLLSFSFILSTLV